MPAHQNRRRPRLLCSKRPPAGVLLLTVYLHTETADGENRRYPKQKESKMPRTPDRTKSGQGRFSNNRLKNTPKNCRANTHAGWIMGRRGAVQ